MSDYVPHVRGEGQGVKENWKNPEMATRAVARTPGRLAV